MKNMWLILITAVVLFWGNPMQVCAEDELISEFDFSEIQSMLDELSGGDRIDFGTMVSSLISGDAQFSFELIKDLAADQFLYEINYNRSSILHIIMIAIVAAVFTNFASVFQNQQTSEVSFYVIYLLLITVLLASFQVMLSSAAGVLESLVEFTRVLAPAYFLAVAFAKGATTATVFYNILLFAIYLVNWFILKFILPLVQVYVILVMVNHLSKEDFISRFTELIKTAVDWILRTLLALVIGVNVIQSMLAPVIDSVKTSVWNKAAGAIPGVGGAVNAVTEVVLGSAMLIKNGIGVAALVIIIILCVVPVLKLIVFVLMYKLAAAVIQPVSDKRMTGCVSGVGEGANMLLKVVLTAVALFFITIAIVASSTS